MLATVVLVVVAIAIVRDGSIVGKSIAEAPAVERADNDTLRVMADGTTVVNTALLCKDVSGFGGPVPLNIYIKDGEVARIEAQANSETPDFFNKASALFARWQGKAVAEAAEMEVDGVSGATFSSRAIIENVKSGLAYAAKSSANDVAQPLQWPDMKGWAALAVALLGALLPIWIKNRRYHIAQLIMNVAVLGFWCGTFVSYSLLVRIASHGVSLTASLAPIVMLIVAFIYPLFGRKSHYCTNICPLGSAQELASHASKRKIRLSNPTVKRLTTFRRMLWGLLMLLSLTGVWSGWMDYELFTAFLFNAASAVVVVFALVFLVLAVFVPRPYCRFVCPTGTLLKLTQRSE